MTELGAKRGLGRGQVESYKFNWRSFSNLLAPLAFSRLFAMGKARGDAALPFVGAAAFVAIAELLMLFAVREQDLCAELGIERVQ